VNEEYFTIPEVAERLKVTPQAVYKWMKQGKLAYVFVGTDRRVTSAAIAAFIKASTESQTGGDSGKMGSQQQSPSLVAA